MKEKSDIGVIGLAVMGSNLALNMESRGYTVSVYNRSGEVTEAFIAEKCEEKNFRAAFSLKELAMQLEKPRKVFLMVKAGEAVDSVLSSLYETLEPGDIIIDGGNSYFKDTERRVREAEEKGFLYVGCGISGGEEGALKGPSMMPGGSKGAKDLVMPILLSICARTDAGEACCSWIGEGGSGHFVKMVHNGIEYGDMQILCETYDIMKKYLGMENDQCGRTFGRWAKQELSGYLAEITGAILQKKDEDGSFLVDKILDAAGQKGTGKWTSMEAMDRGSVLTVIDEAVNSRNLSALKDERIAAAKLYDKESYSGTVVPAEKRFMALDELKSAAYAAKIISYAQGFALMKAASEHYGWTLNLGEIALTWRGGCIIRSSFLDDIKRAYVNNINLDNLLLDEMFAQAVKNALPGWKQTLAAAVLNGIPVPALASALEYFEGYISPVLPANLLQAMRDYFGAHTYERVDRPRGEFFHSLW